MSKVQDDLYKAYSAINRLQAALEWPCRPFQFQPIADAWREVSDMDCQIATLTKKLELANQNIEYLKTKLELEKFMLV